MAVELCIKNTFLDIVETDVIQSRRSCSVPRSWKPVSMDALALTSDASTVASEDCTSVADQDAFSAGPSGSDDSDGSSSEHHDDPSSKQVLCLDGAIDEGDKLRSTKLCAKARLFEPVAALPRDMCCVLTAGQASLCAIPKILNVHMSAGMFGGATTIVGFYAKGSLQVLELVKALSIVKMALLDAAAHSTQTYVIGYARQPFTDTGRSGFSVKLGSVPAIAESSTCWDTYQKGYCPRPSTCRWCHHPHDGDTLKVIVMLNEVDTSDES